MIKSHIFLEVTQTDFNLILTEKEFVMFSKILKIAHGT